MALVQAIGPDYPAVLARALRYPEAGDEDGGALNVSSGEIAIFSTAADGGGTYSVPLLPAQPGPVPPVPGPPSHKVDPGLLLSAVHTGYKVKVRWYTELGEGTASRDGSSFQCKPTTERGTRSAADQAVRCARGMHVVVRPHGGRRAQPVPASEAGSRMYPGTVANPDDASRRPIGGGAL